MFPHCLCNQEVPKVRVECFRRGMGYTACFSHSHSNHSQGVQFLGYQFFFVACCQSAFSTVTLCLPQLCQRRCRVFKIDLAFHMRHHMARTSFQQQHCFISVLMLTKNQIHPPLFYCRQNLLLCNDLFLHTQEPFTMFLKSHPVYV